MPPKNEAVPDGYFILDKQNLPFVNKETRYLKAHDGPLTLFFAMIFILMAVTFVFLYYMVYQHSATLGVHISQNIVQLEIVIGLIAVGTLLGLYVISLRGRRRRRLARSGVLITGKIETATIDHWHSSKGGDGNLVKITYRFTDPATGKDYHNKAEANYPAYVKHFVRPVPDMSVYVLFLNARLYRLL